MLGAKGLLGKAALFVPLPVRMSVRSIVFFSLNTSSKEDKNTFAFQAGRVPENGPDSACGILGILLCVDGEVGRIRRSIKFIRHRQAGAQFYARKPVLQ